MIIDAHNHVWPDRIAEKALAGNIEDMALVGDGKVSGLAAAQEKAGIDLSVCLAVANTAAHVEASNRFIGSLDRSRFIPFGTVHPDLGVAENLEHLRAADVKGVKLHPIFQRVQLDDTRLVGLLEALAGEYPVIVHVGAGAGSDGSICTPAMLRRIADDIPELCVIGCHLGGYHMVEDAARELIGSRIYLDTSWPPSLATLERSTVVDLLRRHGTDRVVFSSDWPTADPAAELQAVRDLGLGDDETEAILGGTMAGLLGLS